MKEMLAAEGVPADQIRTENFDTAMAAAVINAPAASRQKAAAGKTAGHQFDITFSASGRTVSASGSLTLLEAAEAEGIPMMFSCRSGVCQACRTRVADGEVDCQSSVLDPEDRAAGFILPCVSWAQSNCVLEA
jgi:ferredoxin